LKTHRGEASTVRYCGSGDHGEVAAAFPGGDGVHEDAQEVTTRTVAKEDALGFPAATAKGGWRSRPWR
jgi:hypothetical protein